MITMSQLASLRRLGKKAITVAPIVVTNPRLLPLMREGVHPEIYQRMNGAWLHGAGIRTVLDIGANTGQFSRTMHALLPNATVYAFEPQADTFQALTASFGGSPKLIALHTAVGDHIGETEFHQSTFAQSSSVLPMTELHKDAFPWASESAITRVPISTLDALTEGLALKGEILVKIDVQGFEDRVLQGGESTIRRSRFVLIETAYEQLYEGEATFDAVFRRMNELGFKFAGNLDQVRNPDTGLPLYADALFTNVRGDTSERVQS
jgi:FkbM family methyltransferase